MWHNLLVDARFHLLLLKTDQQIAAEAREKGCPACGGVVHVAAYPRKPRCGLSLPGEYDIRLSFCCARDGCRQRVTPASVRFLGRRVYLALIVVLVPVLRHGPSPTRVRRLQELVGVSRRTVERWCKWWHTEFVDTPFWRIACAGFGVAVAAASLPTSALESFVGDHQAKLLGLLRFLGPLSVGT